VIIIGIIITHGSQSLNLFQLRHGGLYRKQVDILALLLLLLLHSVLFNQASFKAITAGYDLSPKCLQKHHWELLRYDI